jgi:hypothetical protein
MKRSNAVNDDIFKETRENSPTMDASKWSIVYHFLSNMMTEALVVLDFDQKNFRYIPNNDLILCGYTQETPKELGFDFFKEAIHPKDLSFWKNVHKTILDSLSVYLINIGVSVMMYSVK